MVGWTPQWYENVPDLVKVKEYVSPVARLLEPHEPSSPAILWATVSLLVQVTVVPVVMVRTTGSKAKFAMETLASLDWTGGKVPAGVGAVFGPQAGLLTDG